MIAGAVREPFVPLARPAGVGAPRGKQKPPRPWPGPGPRSKLLPPRCWRGRNRGANARAGAAGRGGRNRSKPISYAALVVAWLPEKALAPVFILAEECPPRPPCAREAQGSAVAPLGLQFGHFGARDPPLSEALSETLSTWLLWCSPLGCPLVLCPTSTVLCL